MIKKLLRKTFDSVGKNRLYFNRGYVTYIAILLILFNSVTLAFNYVIKEVPFLYNIFPRFWLFGVIFLIVLIPLAILLGLFDYKKGTFKKEQVTALRLSPAWNKETNHIWKEIFERLDKIEKLLEDQEK